MRFEGSYAGRRVTRIVGDGRAFGITRGRKKKPTNGMADDSEDVLENLGIERMM